MELAIVMAISGVVLAIVPGLVWHGTQAVTLLPRTQAVTQVAMEILHGMVEGGPSTLSGATLRGLRSAARQRTPPEPAIWLAETSRLGYAILNDPVVASDNQYVILSLTSESIRRSVSSVRVCPPPATAEETMPYYPSPVRILTSVAQPLFRYYDGNGVQLSPAGCTSGSGIRRVDIALTAQTGAGQFEQGDAQIDLSSSVAIRFP